MTDSGRIRVWPDDIPSPSPGLQTSRSAWSAVRQICDQLGDGEAEVAGV